jgi:hypothetical protein
VWGHESIDVVGTSIKGRWETPEAYQVSNRHFDALLELTNGDMEDGYITSEEVGVLQVAGYCNVVTHYIRDRAGKLSAYKKGAAEEE